MKRVIHLALLLWMGFSSRAMLSQTSGTQHATTATKAESSNRTKSSDEVQASNVAPDYVIGSDDTLHISVWKEPDLTETLPVRPDGKISMPLLNDITAAGLTPLQLRDEITERLKKYVADPRVTVVVTGMNSRRVFATGEVLHTGPIPLLPHMTVLQAWAQAGFTQFANPKAIYLLRIENGKQQKIPFNYKEVVKGNHPEQNIELKPGDTIVVP
jgi:polysaccharide export outer membrane protein